jgi:hypothetical protein
MVKPLLTVIFCQTSRQKRVCNAGRMRRPTSGPLRAKGPPGRMKRRDEREAFIPSRKEESLSEAAEPQAAGVRG